MKMNCKSVEKTVQLVKAAPEEMCFIAEVEADQRWNELFAKSPDFLTRVADEAIADREAGLVEPLDPDTL